MATLSVRVTKRLKGEITGTETPAGRTIAYPCVVGDEPGTERVKPTYPVILYPHKEGGGDAISSGLSSTRGSLAALRGKFIFWRHQHGAHLVGRPPRDDRGR